MRSGATHCVSGSEISRVMSSGRPFLIQLRRLSLMAPVALLAWGARCASGPSIRAQGWKRGCIPTIGDTRRCALFLSPVSALRPRYMDGGVCVRYICARSRWGIRSIGARVGYTRACAFSSVTASTPSHESMPWNRSLFNSDRFHCLLVTCEFSETSLPRPCRSHEPGVRDNSEDEHWYPFNQRTCCMMLTGHSPRDPVCPLTSLHIARTAAESLTYEPTSRDLVDRVSSRRDAMRFVGSWLCTTTLVAFVVARIQALGAPSS